MPQVPEVPFGDAIAAGELGDAPHALAVGAVYHHCESLKLVRATFRSLRTPGVRFLAYHPTGHSRSSQRPYRSPPPVRPHPSNLRERLCHSRRQTRGRYPCPTGLRPSPRNNRADGRQRSRKKQLPESRLRQPIARENSPSSPRRRGRLRAPYDFAGFEVQRMQAAALLRIQSEAEAHRRFWICYAAKPCIGDRHIDLLPVRRRAPLAAAQCAALTSPGLP